MKTKKFGKDLYAVMDYAYKKLLIHSTAWESFQERYSFKAGSAPGGMPDATISLCGSGYKLTWDPCLEQRVPKMIGM